MRRPGGRCTSAIAACSSTSSRTPIPSRSNWLRSSPPARSATVGPPPRGPTSPSTKAGCSSWATRSSRSTGSGGPSIETFSAAREAFGRGSPVTLRQNFRTVEPIVDFVNGLFGALIQEEPGRQPAYEPLVADRSAVQGIDQRPVVFGGPHPDGVRAQQLREAEAADVAGAISQIMDRRSRWLVHRGRRGDAAGPEWDLPKLSDIVILIPTRTSLGVLQEALEQAHIPYRADTGSLVFDSQEVPRPGAARCGPSTIRPTRSRWWPRCARRCTGAATTTSTAGATTAAGGTTARRHPTPSAPTTRCAEVSTICSSGTGPAGGWSRAPSCSRSSTIDGPCSWRWASRGPATPGGGCATSWTRPGPSPRPAAEICGRSSTGWRSRDPTGPGAMSRSWPSPTTTRCGS